ncbi:MAG: histidine kinase [Pseudomonadota bacterium]
MDLNVLIIEDSEDDALLLVAELELNGYQLDYERVYNKQGMIEALERRNDWDIIISDHSLPGFSSIAALLELLKRNLDIPLIIVSGTIGEEMAVEAMKAGAYDFVMKDHLSRLAPAINNALEAAQAKQRVSSYQQRLRELTTHIETVRERERALIARDIHDEIGGLLTALKMDTRWLEKRFSGNGDDAEEKFVVMGEHLDNAIKSMRRIITDLRPAVLDDLGLVAALEWQLEDFCKRYGIDCRFHHDIDALNLSSKEHEITVFRIFQESLTNIAKHARARHIDVRLHHDVDNRSISLTIFDDGVGIDDENKLKKGSYGILGMNERAASIGGSLDVRAGDSGGTQVTLSLPLNGGDD